MASEADLESREANCNSVDDYVALAKDALAEPADKAVCQGVIGKGRIGMSDAAGLHQGR